MQSKWAQYQLIRNESCNKNKGQVNINTNDLYRRIVGVTMTQLSKDDRYAQVSVKEGIKRHGDRAVAAILNEFTQLNNKQVFKPRDASELSISKSRAELVLIDASREGI